MGSMHHPRMYDAATLATIKAAFHDVWDTIEGQDLMQVAACDEDLKAVIIRRLTDLVGEGTTSREDLRTKVLSNMPLG
jgi:hypothetical protein